MSDLLDGDIEDSSVARVEAFPVGGPNEINHVILRSGREVVLKIVNKGTESGHDRYQCARETVALQLSSQSSLSVPKVLSAHTGGKRLGRPYFVMECLKGTPLLMCAKDISGSDIHGIGLQVGQSISSLHSITIDRYGDLPVQGHHPVPHHKPEIWGTTGELSSVFCRRVAFLSQLYAERGILDLQDSLRIEKSLVARAEDVLRGDLSPSLLQSDLAPKNILVSQENESWGFSGIVDFDRSLSLCPEAELGIMENQWQLNASPERLESYASFRRGFIDGYQPRSRLSENWGVRTDLFCALESYGRIQSESAQDHLSRYISDYASVF